MWIGDKRISESVDWTDRLIGCIIDIHYLVPDADLHDNGKVVAIHGPWIELETKGRTFMIPISAVRLIKVLKSPDVPERVLLRPAVGPSSSEPGDTG